MTRNKTPTEVSIEERAGVQFHVSEAIHHIEIALQDAWGIGERPTELLIARDILAGYHARLARR